jgi:NAD(P)-dependent dehydrogenase (short-subunit alcohol dehydrogenase family)
MSQTGQYAIVTGGSSGIGRAIVDCLRAGGTRVAILDVNDPGPGSGADFVACDVSDEKAVVAAVDQAVQALGGLDRAFINAGIGGVGAIVDLTGDDWDRVQSVDLRGAFLTLRETARAMLRSGGDGSIILTSSVCGFLADRRMAHYNAAKAGAIALAKVAAVELGPRHIRVNVIAPGVTETPMAQTTDTTLIGYREAVSARTPLGGFGDPRHVAAAAVCLSELEWVTGQVLAADGGVSLYSPIDVEAHLPPEAVSGSWMAVNGLVE